VPGSDGSADVNSPQKTALLLQAADEADSSSRSTRLRKLARAPIRMLLSKAVELVPSGIDIELLVHARTFWGDRLRVALPDRVGTAIYRHGIFEPGLTKAVITLLRPGMTFFDVGAHVGYFALLASELVGDSGAVHAFEPTPRTCRLLRGNAVSRLNVTINEVAVFDHDTELELATFGTRLAAFNSLFDPRLSEVPRIRPTSIHVRARSIDSYVAATGSRPSLVKIDAESAESHVIAGMQMTIARFRPTITLEVGDMGVSGVPSSRELIGALTDCGYVVGEWGDEGYRSHVARDSYPYGNLIFLPR
jgi:FkbM family methyltransferase